MKIIEKKNCIILRHKSILSLDWGEDIPQPYEVEIFMSNGSWNVLVDCSGEEVFRGTREQCISWAREQMLKLENWYRMRELTS